MTDSKDRFRFVSLLALELDNGDISLPSLPDVVLNIRRRLEKDDCDFERVSRAVSVDPVLVLRLFVFANSALRNRANIKEEIPSCQKLGINKETVAEVMLSNRNKLTTMQRSLS